MQCEAPKIAKLVYNSNNYGFMVLITYNYNITPITMVYERFMVLITIVTGAFVNQLITGGLTL